MLTVARDAEVGPGDCGRVAPADYPSQPDVACAPERRAGDGRGSEVSEAVEAWKRFVTVLQTGEVAEVLDLYSANALYLEPYNPPHRGNLLIQSYLKDWMSGKDGVEIEELAVLPAEDGSGVGVEWTISYTAAGRRWNALPRASFLRLGDAGLVTYHRDYT